MIGAIASIGAILIQQKFQHKREILKIAAEVAREDWTNRSRALDAWGGGEMPPVSVFIHYHFRVLEELSKGDFSENTIRRLSDEQDEILRAYGKRRNMRSGA